jgi:pimeloyl-ACP methyl ester carboxylesterase
MPTTFLLLHGGAGSHSMSALADALQAHGRVIVPIHPGFDGTEKPPHLANVKDLAKHYLQLLERHDLRDVVIAGNSTGGWCAVEMALADASRIAKLVLIDAVGIEGKIVDPMKLEPFDRLPLSFHNPRLAIGLHKAGATSASILANADALKAYTGAMIDTTLVARLGQLRTPTTVIWGESDKIVDVDYGRRYAEAIPGARYVIIEKAGHFPQIEQRDAVVKLITQA